MPASAIVNKRLLEHLNTGVMIVDAQLAVLYMNPAAEALLEISVRRCLGACVTDLGFESSNSGDILREALINNHSFTKREALLRLHNYQQVVVDYTVSPVRHPETQDMVLLIELVGRERVLRINREEHIISSQETARSLVRGLAHEIKNPLGGIRGAAQLLERELPSQDLKEYTNIIIEEADRLRDLVDRMLGPRRLPKQEMINIHEVLERVCQLLSVEVGSKIVIERDYDPSIPELMADKDQLIQAVLNICRNAMQAMLECQPPIHKPTLGLRTRTVRQCTIGHQRHRLTVQIDIRDNGPGIPMELHEHLFYPMVSGRADGTGLGLSIAQSLINQRNGLIEFRSVAGLTVFSIFIPLETV